MEQAQNPSSLRLNALVNGRLGSLSLPRDLTLGGTKNNKKIFKPNLNAVRRKETVKETLPKASPNNRRDKKPYQKKDRPKTNNTKSSRFIQSTSVFSEGLAAAPVIRSDRYLSHRDHEAAAAIEAPTIVKANWNIDKKAEENVINDLLCADDEDSSSDEDVQYMPVLLPLHENKLGFRKHFNVKKEPKFEIKKEVDDVINDETSSGSGSVKILNGPTISLKSEPTATTSLFNGVKKYDDDDLNVSLMKMPDSLPGKGFLPDSDIPTDFTLNQMVEGQIGKILIRKSGKVEVVIGDTKYDLESEEPPGFVEDVMAMPEEKTASNRPQMVHLTSITDRFVLTPSWESLLLQNKHAKNF